MTCRLRAVRLRSVILLCATSLFTTIVLADNHSRLQYLGNEGVAVFHGDTTLLFDPLFQKDYGYYVLVPESTREAMFGGLPPFESITAIFVSHHHGDHFDPADMLRLMANHDSAQLYAPRQAIDAMKRVANANDAEVLDRTTQLDLAYEDNPVSIQSGDILIEAFYVPHSGWPSRMTDIQNIAFRVTVDELASVVHLGDADPNLIHFERHEVQWQQEQVEATLPPYWFFNSRDGNDILKDVIESDHSIGVHVPSSYADSDNIPADLAGYDLFIEPGESRPWLSAPKFDLD